VLRIIPELISEKLPEFLNFILPQNRKLSRQRFRLMSAVFFCEAAFMSDQNTVQREIFSV
jgi:hypothetical protein